MGGEWMLKMYNTVSRKCKEYLKHYHHTYEYTISLFKTDYATQSTDKTISL